MKCSCSVDVDSSDDRPDVLTEKVVTARKEHQCCGCRRIIKPTEKYETAKGLWDGEWRTYKTCIDCLSIRNQFFTDGWFYETLLDDLWNYINDCSGEIPESCISELTPLAMERVCGLIEDTWEKQP